MISVAVCDDEAVFLDIVSEEISLIMKNLNKEYICMTYKSSSEFVKALKDGIISPNIALLDIDMPEINGKQASVALRELYPDCQLIFFTSHEDEIFNAFDYNANGFISKYELSERLEPNIIRVIKNLEEAQPGSVTLDIYGSTGKCEKLSLRYSDILCLECISKKIYVTLADGKYLRIKCGLWREAMRKFDHIPFAVPHQNYIVNMEHISRITENGLIIGPEGKRISISKYRRKDFLSRYTDYSMVKERSC